MLTIEENGRIYKIDDDTGLVVEASEKLKVGASDCPKCHDAVLAQDENGDVYCPNCKAHWPKQEYVDKYVSPNFPPNKSEKLKVGDRVTFGTDREGVIRDAFSTLYGLSYDVDGEEIPGEFVKAASSEVKYENDIAEIVAEFDSYNQMYVATSEEIDNKEAEARRLKLKASALASNSKIALDERVKLDSIVVETTADLMDLDDLRDTYRLMENDNYLSKFRNHREGPISLSGGAMGGQDDASWLGLNDYDIDPQTIEESELVARASTLVYDSRRDLLENDDFFKEALYFANRAIPEEKWEEFARLAQISRVQRIAEEPFVKEANVSGGVDLDDNFDTTLLFL